MTVALTRRQRQIYEFIRSRIHQDGFAPSFEEIGREVGLRSMATVHKHLRALEEKGALKRSRNRSRAIELTGAADFSPSHRLPILGRVAAGSPIEAIETPDEVDVPGEFVGKKESFVLRVTGDSMVEDHIRDGDLIIVERRRSAVDGQMVVALVDGEETTVKRFYRENGRVRLQPANEKMAPMIYEGNRVEIQGVVIGLMRKYGA